LSPSRGKVQETVLKYSEYKEKKRKEENSFLQNWFVLSSFGTEYKAHCVARLGNNIYKYHKIIVSGLVAK